MQGLVKIHSTFGEKNSFIYFKEIYLTENLRDYQVI